MTLLYYDVTRLISRRFNAHATGIDRVDCHCLDQYLQDDNVQLRFVARVRGELVYFSSQLFIDYYKQLKDCWFGKSNSVSPWLTSKLECLGYTDNCLGLKLSQKKLVRFLTRSLYSFSSSFIGYLRSLISTKTTDNNNTYNKVIYFDASHQGLARNKNLLDQFLHATKAKATVYLHDLIPITHPEYTRAGQTDIFKRYIDNILSHKPDCICASRYTENIVKEYAKAQDYQVTSLQVCYPQINPPATDSANVSNYIRELAKQDYCIIVGTIEPRKNHLMLLNIWRSFVDSGVLNIPKLYIVGARGWENEQVIDMLERCSQIQPFIEEINGANDTEVKYLLKSSRSLLFPSFVEGYGLPLIEAQNLGKPIIASNISVFNEIVTNNNAKLISLDRIDLWKQAIIGQSLK
jgi:glycosyltransferase involved in cell wall biosynthesis